MAGQQASSAPAVEAGIKCMQHFVDFVAAIPDKGPHQGQILNSANNDLEQVMQKYQQYVNSRASGIS